MGGHIQSGYVLRLARFISACGGNPAVLEPRASRTPFPGSSFYHAGLFADIDALVDRLSELDRELILVGFSLGGTRCVNFGVESWRSHRVSRVVTISMTYDLALTADIASAGFNRVYERRIIRHFLRVLQNTMEATPPSIEYTQPGPIRTMRDFDEAYTAPRHGYANADDYYCRASSGAKISACPIPLTIIDAANDPLIPASSRPNGTGWPAHCQLHTFRRGGHLGFDQSPGRHDYQRLVAGLSIRSRSCN